MNDITITAAETRIDALLSTMTLEEKVGSLLVARIVTGVDGALWEGTEDESPFGFAPTSELIRDRHVTHVTLMNPAPVAELARWGEEIRKIAVSTRLGIPVSVASDPVHGRSRNPDVAMSGGGFTPFPEPIALAATHDPALVRKAARMIGEELRAAGIHIALHPMADLATEPRWARVSGTFGEDPDLASALVSEYIEGLRESGVAATVKHFPGGGPQRGGEDAHFERGAHTIYPGGRFDDHVRPFAAAIDAGAARVMPGYAAPLGLEYDEVGFAFERRLITGLLRERLGFDGVVVTDFNIVHGMRLPRLGVELPVRAWGMLGADPVQRVVRLFDAGVDQFGGEDDPSPVLEAVASGLVPEERIDESVRRVLREKERLGLFDDAAGRVVSSLDIREHIAIPSHLAVGERVQRASIVALQGEPIALSTTTRVYLEGMDADALSGRAIAVTDPASADVAVLRLTAPFEQRDGMLEQGFHSGSLEFSEEEIARIAGIAEQTPTIIDVFLDRPAVLTPLSELGVTLVGTFGVEDRVVLDAITGRAATTGRLPFDLPRSMAAVEASREDVPFDTADPLWRFGHGLSWAPIIS
ncbi:beta-glucosidase [Microbacterium natoriense]|uniref:beta-glucosidase n=1 Tax=Microbacterium natoriense TaxID=284570 RepID=A0AAW8EU76_9MICO|nr:glycoside hydrolase family 3 N-terminal domain-containing protein [Microbacterium natoriense]MDQ0646184.1 beta-glucosidase [Microbacterium natoriense]